MLRNHAVLAVFVTALLGLSGLSSIARAQSCDSDFDCTSGNWCEYEGGDVATGGDTPVEAPVCDGKGCPEPDPGTEPVSSTGSCQPLPKGLCVEQADCTTGLTCQIGTIGTDCAEPAPAEPGASDAPLPVEEECTPSQTPAPYGYCTLPVTKCTTDAQCLLGLKCVDSSSGGGTDGSVGSTDPACPSDAPDCNVDPAPEPAPAPVDPQLTCQVAFDDCTGTTECGAGYECVERGVSCTSSGSSGSGGAAGGSTDPVPPTQIDKQNDDNCEYESKCYPKLVPCENDAQCQGGWTCYAFEADSDVASELWGVQTAGKGCLPKGLALAAEASISEGVGAGHADDTATGAPEAGGADDGKNASTTGGNGSNCAVGVTPSSQGAGWLFAMALGVLIRRRRV